MLRFFCCLWTSSNPPKDKNIYMVFRITFYPLFLIYYQNPDPVHLSRTTWVIRVKTAFSFRTIFSRKALASLSLSSFVYLFFGIFRLYPACVIKLLTESCPRARPRKVRQTGNRSLTHCHGSCFQYSGPSLVCVFPAVDLPRVTYLRSSMINSAATSGFFSYRLFCSFGSAKRSYS